MRLKSFLTMSFLATLALGQTPPSPTAPKPAPPNAAGAKRVAPPSRVDSVIELVKTGLSESLIIRTIQKENKPVNLGTADLIKLKKAGVSENIISVLMDPSSTPITIPATAAAPAPVAATSVPLTTPTASVVPETRPPVPEATRVAARASASVKIPNRTPVKLVMLKTLSSGTAKTSETFSLAVDEDVLVNGRVVIAKGAVASGRVTIVRAKNLTSRNGLLEVTIDSAKSIDGKEVPLRGTVNKDGGGTGFGRLGKNVEIPEGFPVSVVVDGETEIKLPE